MSLNVTPDIDASQRAKFADGLDRLASDATRFGAALRAGEDSDAVLCMVAVHLSACVLDELRDVFMKALLARKAAQAGVPDDISSLFTTRKENNT